MNFLSAATALGLGLKFIPTRVREEDKIRRQLLGGFECFRIFGSVFSLSILLLLDFRVVFFEIKLPILLYY